VSVSSKVPFGFSNGRFGSLANENSISGLGSRILGRIKGTSSKGQYVASSREGHSSAKSVSFEVKDFNDPSMRTPG
jgi:hypothetical protein